MINMYVHVHYILRSSVPIHLFSLFCIARPPPSLIIIKWDFYDSLYSSFIGFTVILMLVDAGQTARVMYAMHLANSGYCCLQIQGWKHQQQYEQYEDGP